MYIKFSMESVPCSNNSYHLFLPCCGFDLHFITSEYLFIKYSLMHQVLF